MVATVYGGQLYASSDAGVTWTARESNMNWYSVASSVDGSKLVAVVNIGRLYTSSDAGGTWQAVNVVAAPYLTGAQYTAIELQYLGNNTFTVLSHTGNVSYAYYPY